MTPGSSPGAGFLDLWAYLTHNPYVLAYFAGCLTGWTAARRSTRYMLGGRP